MLAYRSDFSGKETGDTTVNWSCREIAELQRRIEAVPLRPIFMPKRTIVNHVRSLIRKRRRPKYWFYLPFRLGCSAE